ncbi:hypothetical protein AX15_003750 [Amanita polypyramis BW_CC]|nr:hypothetical protein AX15_003750 [Amanita polypyramis BW_CC]
MPDVLSDPWVTKQLHFLNGSIPEEVITGVKGNAPRKVKEAPLKAIQSLHKTQRRLYNLPVAGRLTVSEVSITPSLENATKTDCRVFCKININAGTFHFDASTAAIWKRCFWFDRYAWVRWHIESRMHCTFDR